MGGIILPSKKVIFTDYVYSDRIPTPMLVRGLRPRVPIRTTPSNSSIYIRVLRVTVCT